MMSKRFLILLRWSLLLTCLPFARLLASSESYVQSITGHLKKGDSVTVIDDKFLNLPLSEWNRLTHQSIEDIVSFELRQDTALNFYTKSFSCTLNVTIKYFTSRDQQTPKEIDNIDLVVKYDTTRGKSYPVVARYRFKDAFKVTVVINSISSPEWKDKLPDVFRLKSQIVVERKYPFDKGKNGTLHLGAYQPLPETGGGVAGWPVAGGFLAGGPMSDGPVPSGPMMLLPASGFDLQVVNGVLDISWPPGAFAGAEEYDIEWEFIDAESNRGQYIKTLVASGTPIIPDDIEDGWMDRDATRATITSAPYKINLPYPDGYVLVRVRKVNYQAGTNLRLTDVWVRTDEQGNTALVITAPFNDGLNFQYTGSFAEEGKKKEVLTFFDGVGKNRQIVTLSNADQWKNTGDVEGNPTATVQENIYDVMGRASLSMLPAPVRSSSLNYYPGFNLNTSNQSYSYADLNPGTSCNISANPSSSTSGASQYYSSNNTWLNQALDPANPDYYTRYVPDAQLHPFSVTEYTADNTGRIRRQGGIGQTLAIDGGHARQYFYSKPTPTELERLFGMEVGNSSHYIKNTVVDPNGQSSISYIDANGKTIATALAGKAPTAVDALSNMPTAQAPFNELLIKPADLNVNSGAMNMTASSTFTAEELGDFSILYSVNPLALVTTYGGTNQLCSNCYYTVSVKVTDACGAVVPGGSATTTPFTLNDFTCNVDPAPITQTLVVAGLPVGEYTVSYTLQLSNDAINAQTDYYIQHNTDLSKLEDFFNTELNNLDLTTCYNTCDACKSLTSVADFSSKVMTLLGSDMFSALNAGDPRFTTWINSTYTTLKNRCNLFSCNISTSPCEDKLAELKLDVQPGGQYALYDATALAAGATTGLFLEPQINVLVNYTNSSIGPTPFTADDGTTQTIGSLNQADFIRAYLGHPEWADLFVVDHIEYCSYLWCKDASNTTTPVKNEQSYIFDANLQQAYPSGSDAVSAGYYNHSDVLALLKKDPWFNNGKGIPYYSNMQSDLQAASDVLSMTPTDNGTKLGTKDLVQLIDWLLYCKPANTNVTSTQADASWNSCSPNASCRSATMEWTLYRNYYLQLKSKYYTIAKQLANPNCRDCFIGTDPLATAGCVIAGKISDYSIVLQQINNTYNFYIVYKGGTAPFAGNYTFNWDFKQNFTGQISQSGQVAANAGDMQVLATSITVDPGTQLGLNFIYEVTNIRCTPSALSACAAAQGNVTPPGNCPPSGEFSLLTEPYQHYLSDPVNMPDLYTDVYNIYYVHKVGGVGGVETPVTRPVTVYVGGSYDQRIPVQNEDGSWQTNETTGPLTGYQVTMDVGQSRVFMGQTFTRYTWIETNPRQDLYQYSEQEVHDVSPYVSCAAYNPPQPPPASSCTSDPLYAQYQNKIRVFNDYTSMQAYNSCNASAAGSTTLALAQAQAMQTTLAAAMDNLSTMQGSWLGLLQSVRNEEFASDPTALAALNDTKLSDLTTKMQQLSAAYLQYASQNGQPLIISSTLPAGVAAPNGYTSFKDIFTAVIGTSLMQRGFGPDLIDDAYPWDRQPTPADYNVNQLTPDIAGNVAANLNAFQSRYQTAGSPGTFGAYLKAQLGDDYFLTDAQLSDLQSRITAGCPNPYLADPLLLPVALTVSPGPSPVKSSTSCGDITALQSQFAIDYPGVMAGVTQAGTETKLYQLLITNYINHALGYPLSYGDYAPILNNGACNGSLLVYDKPQTLTVFNDYFDCTASLIKQTYTLAGQEYDLYITQKRIEFRNAYVSKCLSNQASANLKGSRRQYQYTLYYYDQSGNLVKTIPPEGVRLLTDDQIAEVEDLPAQDPSACVIPPPYVVYDATTILNDISSGLQNGSAQSMEMWLYSANGSSTRQLRMVTPDNKYMYQVAISGGKIWVELYTLLPDGNGGISITLTNQAVGLLSAQFSLLNWTHLVFQSSGGLVSGAMQLYVDGNKLTMLTGTAIGDYPYPWEIDAGYTLPAMDLSVIKHIRLYNATLTDAQVVVDFKNSCLAPSPELQVLAQPFVFPTGSLLVWGRLDAPSFCNSMTGRTTAIQVPNKGSLLVSSNANPAGAINGNAFPAVTNNFTMEFWVQPNSNVFNTVHVGALFSGVDDHPPYAIFPINGGSGGLAGAGVSVGVDGITVFEHADSYLPAVLDLRTQVQGWTHVAVVYQNGIPSIYVNGVLRTAGTTASGKMVCPSFNFGGSVYGVMPGGLDEVRIWNYARTGSQIADAYSRVLRSDEQQGLLGYWPMDATNGSEFLDVSCGGNSGQTFTAPAEGWSSTGAPITETNYIEFAGRFIVPNHGLPTDYAYNSLNSVIKQSSPDGGASNFIYDRLGRLVVSQNAEQLQPTQVDDQNPAGRYSYTRYDVLGRIAEVGEKLGGGVFTESTGRDDDLLTAWYTTGSNRQVTVTAYDVAPAWAPPELLQNNLRKRVSATALLSAGSDPTQNRQAASYFNYDIDGNVSDQIQENAALAASEAQLVTGSNGLKHIQYQYDLLSGKVNKVLYQDGKWDEFYYQYKYDDDNRLVAAYSDRYNDGLLSNWTKDASFIYYHHGPLARMELGAGRVQGLDYAYTLQGWLKGVNGQQLATSAGPSTDIGGDGNASSVYSGFERDVMGYSLGYYAGDYQAIGGSSANAFGSAYVNTGGATTSGQDLFNGNIGNATYAIDPFEYYGLTGNHSGFAGYAYRYDQLNRLTAMDRHTINPYSTPAAWNNSSGTTTDYHEQVSYDGNGNILTYHRNGRVVPVRGNSMDQLRYDYNRDANGNLVNNKLRDVYDSVTSASPAGDPVDISRQPTDNYTYDAIGNLVHDQTQNLQRLNWTVYGKMASIGKVDGSSLGYGYDAGGHRITKTVKALDGSTTATHYIRDAQGNVLAVYQYKATAAGVATEADWLEQHLYGSSRLGMLQPHVVIPSSSKLTNESYDGTHDQTEMQGNRLYELTNHLGNVMATISDGLNPAGVTPNPNVVSAQDYYPFGMQMPGRSYIAGSSLNYRYGFNGKENDNEVEGTGNQIDYGMRVYDPRIGRFLSVDPLTNKYPWYAPYQYAGNQPIWAIDLDGLEPIRSKEQQAKEDKAQQELMDADDIKYNSPRDGANGLFHLHSATPAEEDSHPVRAYVKNFVYYYAKYLTPDVAADAVFATWGSKEITTDKKIAFTAQFVQGMLLTGGEGEGEGFVEGESLQVPYKRLPKSNGSWSGERGNSNWHSTLSEVNEITEGEGIPFKEGKVDFSKWSKAEFEVEGLNGTKADFQLIYEKMAKDLGFKNKTAAQKWLKDNKLTPHHHEGTTIQIVPFKLNNKIPHIGAASKLRSTLTLKNEE